MESKNGFIFLLTHSKQHSSETFLRGSMVKHINITMKGVGEEDAFLSYPHLWMIYVLLHIALLHAITILFYCQILSGTLLFRYMAQCNQIKFKNSILSTCFLMINVIS